MTIIEVTKKELDLKQYVKRSAQTNDCSRLINSDTLVLCNGIPIVLYKKIEPGELLRHSVETLKYQTSTRTGGLKTTSRIFGYRPRNTMRNDFCSATGLSNEQPDKQRVLCEFATHVEAVYKQYFPEIYGRHKTEAEKIDNDWRISDIFTSGIVNKNNPLKYHHDAGNVKNVASNMVVFKRDCAGGYLAMPEYDMMFECADNTMMVFDGQKILHGVTPIYKKTNNAYRFSIVYYTLVQMWQCLDLEKEIERANGVRFKRETNRAKGIIGTMATNTK